MRTGLCLLLWSPDTELCHERAGSDAAWKGIQMCLYISLTGSLPSSELSLYSPPNTQIAVALSSSVTHFEEWGVHVLPSRVCSLACSPWCSQSCHFITAGGKNQSPQIHWTPSLLLLACRPVSWPQEHLSGGAAPAPTVAVLGRWQQVSSGDSTNKGLCDPGRSGQGDSKLDPPPTQSWSWFCHACEEQHY